jgi:hypothetical protein
VQNGGKKQIFADIFWVFKNSVGMGGRGKARKKCVGGGEQKKWVRFVEFDIWVFRCHTGQKRDKHLCLC